MTDVQAASFEASDGTWRWSGDLAPLLGFAAGEVPPTRDALLAHVHPEDRDELAAALVPSPSGERAFGLLVRLKDAQRRRRTATVSGTAHRSGVRGVVADVTRQQSRADAEARALAVAEASASRAVIDQAIGGLRLLYALDSAEGFALLTWASQRSGSKVRAVAEALVEALATAAPLSDDARRAVDALVVEVAGGWAPRGGAGAPPAGRAVSRERTQVQVASESLPGLVLVVVQGELDVSTGAAVTAPLLESLKRCGPGEVLVVDVSRALHVGPVALSLLEVLHHRAARNGVRLRVVAQPALRTALAHRGVDARGQLAEALQQR